MLDVSMRHRLAKFMEEFSLQQHYCCCPGNRSKNKTTLGLKSRFAFPIFFRIRICTCLDTIMDKLENDSSSIFSHHQNGTLLKYSNDIFVL